MEDILNQIKGLFYNQHMMTRLAVSAISYIRFRTSQGISIEGTSFGNYSKGYEKKRTKAGLPIHPVTLTYEDITGMMSSRYEEGGGEGGGNISFDLAKDYSSATIYMSNPKKELIMQYLSIMGAGRNRKIFHFWGLNTDEENQLAEIVDEELMKNFSLIRGSVL